MAFTVLRYFFTDAFAPYIRGTLLDARLKRDVASLPFFLSFDGSPFVVFFRKTFCMKARTLSSRHLLLRAVGTSRSLFLFSLVIFTILA